LALVAGCSSGTPAKTLPPSDAGRDTDASTDAGVDAAAYCDGGSCIQHLVVIVQENHTFDNHFGGYCTATPGSNPTCNVGPSCCEKMPATEPSGTAATVLTDLENESYDPNHTADCEASEIDNGKMDGYVTADGGAACQSAQNVAISDPSVIQPYWTLAASGAIADHYFQPSIGESSANDMFLHRTSSRTTSTAPSARSG
jgi:phospholipase C